MERKGTEMIWHGKKLRWIAKFFFQDRQLGPRDVMIVLPGKLPMVFP